MMNRRRFAKDTLASAALWGLMLGRAGPALASDDSAVRRAIDDAFRPPMARHKVPGLAIGVTIDGVRHFVEYGSASPKEHLPVTRETLFELGSVSKTFTATLATLAALEGKLALTDTVGRHMPELEDAPVGALRLLDLGTHTGGGFPLQLPESVKTGEELTAWYRAWRPTYPAGAMRTYANPSIALLGKATAVAMGEGIASLAERRLFPALGLARTYINVPAAEMQKYAWGTNRDGKAVRVHADTISDEAYGVKSNTVDLLRWLEVQMGAPDTAPEVARAVQATHTGYYRTGPFIQDLVWEQYPDPARLADMMLGNSSKTSLKPTPATAITPPMPARADAVLNKTGSTAGFGAYLVCHPARRLGLVMLANKGFPNEERTKAAWDVMQRVAG